MRGVLELSNNMIPVYINHHDVLVDRKKYLETVIKNCIWVTEPTKENITDQQINEWYLNSSEAWNAKCQPLYSGMGHYPLTKGSIVCNLGHIEGWRQFLESNEAYGVFLEDDAIIECDNFENKIEEVLTDPPNDLDVLFIGGGFDHNSITKTKTIVKENFYLKHHPATNCACSYILTKESAKKLLDSIKPFTLSIDFELNYWFYKHNLNVYHYIPYFVKEGSKTGQYTSAQY